MLAGFLSVMFMFISTFYVVFNRMFDIDDATARVSGQKVRASDFTSLKNLYINLRDRSTLNHSPAWGLLSRYCFHKVFTNQNISHGKHSPDSYRDHGEYTEKCI